MMILFWILLLMAAYYLFGDNKKFSQRQSQGTEAEEILKMRYVKGEINEETFEKMKKNIF